MAQPQNDLQALSKRVFNALHRLTIVASMWSTRDIAHDVEALAGSTGVSRTTVHTELQVLVEVGAVQRMEAVGRVYYKVIDGPFWSWSVNLIDQTDAADGTDKKSLRGQG